MLKAETTHNTQFSHKHMPHEWHSYGYKQGQLSALGSGYGQLSWNISHQIQRHKLVTGFAELLLAELCFLQGYDSEVHWRRPQSTASNENYWGFFFRKWGTGGTRMRCDWASEISTQVHFYLGILSILHCFCVPQTFDPHWLLTNTALTSRKWIHMGVP